jgi:pyruvate,water dikinase
MRIGLSSKGVKYLIDSEVESALEAENQKKLKNIAEKRILKCCYIVQEGKIKVYEGNECEKIIKIKEAEIIKEEISNNDVLTGMTAYYGKVVGIVKIVLLEGDVSKVKKGDILVSSSTNPDLIAGMKRAGAIVTDAGGITSHASIVSRELKKPCVVGTKYATRFLLDGMKVEVDANKGIVRILK